MLLRRPDKNHIIDFQESLHDDAEDLVNRDREDHLCQVLLSLRNVYKASTMAI